MASAKREPGLERSSSVVRRTFTKTFTAERYSTWHLASIEEMQAEV